MSSTSVQRDDLAALVRDTRAAASPLRTYIKELHERLAPVRDGAPASYIPELAVANPDWFGISIVTCDGK